MMNLKPQSWKLKIKENPICTREQIIFILVLVGLTLSIPELVHVIPGSHCAATQWDMLTKLQVTAETARQQNAQKSII
jgi:hypothetical protein